MRGVLMLVVVGGCATSPQALQSGTGSVSLSSNSYAVPAYEGTGTAYAKFTDAAMNQFSCRTSSTFGPCAVRTHCEDTRDPITFYSAGVITLDNTAAPVTLTPGGTCQRG
jgi:hypothetical protein